MFNKTKLQNGVHLYIRKTEQFKTVNVTIKWKAPLDQKKASERTVLANVMEDSTKQYPTLSSMRKALDEFTVQYYLRTSQREALSIWFHFIQNV
ncbi:hypothetical protein [Sporosarcina sp. P21c]|uniref:hypothetical protein n=1 Tax=Sporosarcina sp. P21c TaxID=2048255 RepID=UPI001E63C563|nr:hypothetical protein [Sporosarcina sp. P21c]